jgi:hypothetical protein
MRLDSGEIEETASGLKPDECLDPACLPGGVVRII